MQRICRNAVPEYMILSYASQQDYDGMVGKESGKPAWSREEFEAMAAFMTEFNGKLEAAGELVETRGLVEPVHTRRIGAKNGELFVTDGPYAETQEVLAGYWIVECESFDRATEIASELKNCPAPAHLIDLEYVDVRPLADAAPDFD
ncbi:YciI family protein [Nocardia sp.]|uniref:YciI family protein n=2 Tax=Nocardia TaxID=1817 RepID=UPI0018E5359F|nr:YciI family protein [Nocardia sp.]